MLLQFTHITLQHVTFLCLKGIFQQMKGKKDMVENQNYEFANFYIYWEIFFELRYRRNDTFQHLT